MAGRTKKPADAVGAAVRIKKIATGESEGKPETYLEVTVAPPMRD